MTTEIAGHRSLGHPKTTRTGSGLAAFLAALGLFHVALIFLLPDAEQRFMLGDRANDRTVKMETLLSADSADAFFATLFRQASPGDYILFAPAYTLGGPTAVMLQNTVLILLGVWFVYKLAALFFSRHAATFAAVVYALLPATLFHPHAFVSEAICNPLLIVAAYFIARHVRASDPPARDVTIAALITAVLCFTRHVYLLLPLFFMAVLLFDQYIWRSSKTRAATIMVVLGYSLVGAWGIVAHFGEAHYDAGKSVGGLGSNLFLRAERMSQISGEPLPPAAEKARAVDNGILTMTPADFGGYVLEHPVPFAKTVVSDLFNITANPGIAMVYGRFFGFFDLGERHYSDYNKWREVRDREGIPGLLRELWRTSPRGLILNAVGAAAWALFLALAAVGAVRLLVDRAQPVAIKLLLIGLPFYLVGVSSLAAGYTRWDHRSPAEFALAILFMLGVEALENKLRRRR